ncbi:MAG: polyprenyl synthetase family protein, partial [Anaerolineales bacterium]
GALIAPTDPPTQAHYKDFGYHLGMAFQALDDVLGIWGDSQTTGKSAESDLVSGKKSLPVIYALSLKGVFAERWLSGPIEAKEVPELAHQLEAEGARDYAQESAACFTDKALNALANAAPSGQAGELLSELADRLLK